MADATAIALATEQEKIAQEALKRQKEEEDALLKTYQTGSRDIYGTAKTASGDLLSGSKSEIEALYGKGYADLVNLVGQESEAAIKESLRPIESKLANQGLLGGPSGALNEALAGAAERVRNTGIGRLADYKTAETGALANVYGNTANQLSALEQAYGGQTQGLLAAALNQQLATTGKATDISDKYTTAGLEAALGTNKISVESEAAQTLAEKQAELALESTASKEATAAATLKTSQDTWDRNYQTVKSTLYRSYRATGMGDAMATEYANRDALKQVGARPT